MAEMDTRLDNVEKHANAALALAIVVLIAQVVLAILLFQAWQNTRAFHHSSRGDPERGLELQDTSRGMPAEASSGPRPQSPPLAAPAPTRPRHPVGRSPTGALGRPVAAFERQQLHRGEADDYYNPSPISRQPTYTADSGVGEQSHGVDYTKQRRENRFEDRHNTNVNDAYYGRRGDKFAHRN